jgi:tol-pal system protein YbgF
MNLSRLAPLTLCIGLAFSSAAAHAFFNDDEARRQVAELRQVVEALNQRIEVVSRNQLDFANQIETLRADVARLNGQIEVLANSLEAAHKRQQDFYVDLDTRLRKFEGGGTTVAEGGTPASATATEAKPDPQAEMRDYEAALGLLRASKFREAQASFEGFIARHAKSPLLPNATYWLGLSLYQQKLYPKAAEVLGKVFATWPADPKAPDALLAQADALVGAKNVDGAVKVLETLVEKYPTSPAVETARARIKTLAPKKK